MKNKIIICDDVNTLKTFTEGVMLGICNKVHEEVLALVKDAPKRDLVYGKEVYEVSIEEYAIDPFWNIMTFNNIGNLDIYLTQHKDRMGYEDKKLWFYDRHRDIPSCAYKYETLAWIVDKHTVLSFHTPSSTISKDIPLKVISRICEGHLVERVGNDILIDKVKVSPALACARNKIWIQCMRWDNVDALLERFKDDKNTQIRLSSGRIGCISEFTSVSKEEFISLLETEFKKVY